MQDDKRWHITTYDDHLVVRAHDTIIGSHTDAVLLAEEMINREPQWGYSIRDASDSEVLSEIQDERRRQDAKWGEQNHPDGTGPETRPLQPHLRVNAVPPHAHARDLAVAFTQETDSNAMEGMVTWTDILLEEVFEALAEDDATALRTELIQVAAVATQWVEAIDRRAQSEAQA